MGKNMVLAAGAALFLSACAGDYDFDGARSLPNQGGPFHQALQGDYADLAESEWKEADWRDTVTFVERSKRAASGETFDPEAVGARDIPSRAVSDLTEARTRLMAALDNGARMANPVMASMAQASFDCWMQEQEEDFQPDDIAACRSNFNTALAALEDSPPVPTPAPSMAVEMPPAFEVFFAFDSSDLDAAAQAVINEVAEAHEKFSPATVLVVGHTDTAGSSDYNIMLSQRRAVAVSDALTEKGIESQRIEAYGETREKVQTGDGVRNAQNRRVDVIFE